MICTCSLYIPANDLAQLNLTVTSITKGTATILSVSAGVSDDTSAKVTQPTIGKTWFDATLSMYGFTAYVDCSAGAGSSDGTDITPLLCS